MKTTITQEYVQGYRACLGDIDYLIRQALSRRPATVWDAYDSAITALHTAQMKLDELQNEADEEFENPFEEECATKEMTPQDFIKHLLYGGKL